MDQLTWKLPKPENLLKEEWKIYSSSETINPATPKINLTFQPWGAFEEHINAIIVQANFTQAFGAYHGTIELNNVTYVIENGYGVAENHFSKW